MDAFVLPEKPAGQGTPYIVNACDLPGTEEVFLHKAYRILDRAFAFRVMFIAYPEF
jgi:hypothetical protein